MADVPVLTRCAACSRLAYDGPTVIIDARELDELRTKALHYDAAASRRVTGKPSRFERDPELAEFVLSVAPGKTLLDILVACHERFGAERSPSRTALCRYIHKARLGLHNLVRTLPNHVTPDKTT